MLGVPRSTLKTLLLHRLKKLGEEAAGIREAAGYKGGKPPK